jgi:hypothetical protein
MYICDVPLLKKKGEENLYPPNAVTVKLNVDYTVFQNYDINCKTVTK